MFGGGGSSKGGLVYTNCTKYTLCVMDDGELIITTPDEKEEIAKIPCFWKSLKSYLSGADSTFISCLIYTFGCLFGDIVNRGREGKNGPSI